MSKAPPVPTSSQDSAQPSEQSKPKAATPAKGSRFTFSSVASRMALVRLVTEIKPHLAPKDKKAALWNDVARCITINGKSPAAVTCRAQLKSLIAQVRLQERKEISASGTNDEQTTMDQLLWAISDEENDLERQKVTLGKAEAAKRRKDAYENRIVGAAMREEIMKSSSGASTSGDPVNSRVKALRERLEANAAATDVDDGDDDDDDAENADDGSATPTQPRKSVHTLGKPATPLEVASSEDAKPKREPPQLPKKKRAEEQIVTLLTAIEATAAKEADAFATLARTQAELIALKKQKLALLT